MEIFKEYAPYYDLMYMDKNYTAEVDYVHSLISAYAPQAKTVFDGGCGTGGHSLLLAEKGFEVLGVDLSAAMIQRANEKKSQAPGANVQFQQGNLIDFVPKKKFDVALLLFHVFGYLQDQNSINQALLNIKNFLVDDGLLILDFWSEEAVKAKPIDTRTKTATNAFYKVYRISEASFDYTKQQADVSFTFFVENLKKNQIEKFTEFHSMRFYQAQALASLLKAYGFEVLLCQELLTGKEPSENTFSLCLVARKKPGN